MYYNKIAAQERQANERARQRRLPKSDPMYLPPPEHVRPHIKRKGGWRHRTDPSKR